MNILNVPIRSISDLKQSPMKIVEQAKKGKTGVYILNRNRDVAVLLDTTAYEKLVKREQEQLQEIEKLKEKIFDLEAAYTAVQRLNALADKDAHTLYPIEEVAGNGWRSGLEDISDDWV